MSALLAKTETLERLLADRDAQIAKLKRSLEIMIADNKRTEFGRRGMISVINANISVAETLLESIND